MLIRFAILAMLIIGAASLSAVTHLGGGVSSPAHPACAARCMTAEP